MSYEYKREKCFRELMIRYKNLSSSIIHYVSEQNDFDVNKANLALLELTGRIVNQREYSRPPRIDNYHEYISVDQIEECIDDVLTGAKILIILRGLPGSGKSHLAKSILRACYPNPNYKHHIHSADNYFMHNGKYMYDSRYVGVAHDWNQKQVNYRIQEGYSPLIVDNTNTQIWEMKWYLDMVVRNGYKLHILEVNTRWAFNVNELTKRNQHKVPKQTILAMLERYQMGITAETLLSTYHHPLVYQKSPGLRRCPPFIESKSVLDQTSNPGLSLPRSKMKGKSKCEKSSSSSEDVEDSSPTFSKQFGLQNRVPQFVKPTLSNSPSAKSPFSFSWDTDLEASMKFWTLNSPPVECTEEKVENINMKVTRDIGVNTTLFLDTENCKILYGRNREISQIRKNVVTQKPGMLDKSCSTCDDASSDRNEDLKKLFEIFKNIPQKYITDMYDDCQGNFDMTFDIFIEDDKDYSYLLNNSDLVTQDENDATELYKSNSEESLEEPYTLLPKYTETKTPIQLPVATGAIKKYSNAQPIEKRESKTSESLSDEENSFESPMSDYESDNDLKSSTPNLEFGNIQLNLGQSLVKQLENEFGEPSNNFPDGFQPVVQIPRSLARQLYAFYIESVYQQMEAQQSILDGLIKEDEAFARKLYEEEIGAVQKPRPEGFLEIMNEQAALKLHNKQLPKLKTPKDLATQLTQKKLFESFPTVEKSVIMEIYHANGLDYKETVEDLLGSVRNGVVSPNTTLREPPISATTICEMEKAQDDCQEAEIVDEEVKTPKEYREEAEFYLKKRNELYQKAQEYHSKGQNEVALFYSQLAQQQTQYFDIANNKAASVFLNENSKQLQNMNTLDLHYLFVKEALAALDVFIDSNIDQLNSTGKVSKDLLIITGRGRRSVNGVSRIRPAVIRRLEARKIRYHKMNEGLLKIKVRKNTPVTNDL